MGFWSSVRSVADSVGDVVETVADVIGDVIEEVGDFVTDIVESAGNVVEDMIGWVADQARKIPVVGGFFGGVLDWIGRTLSSAFDLIGSVIKGAISIIAGVISGVIKILGGIFTLNLSLLFEGFLDIVAGIFGGVVYVLGKLVAFVQTFTYFLQPDERALTRDERIMLGRIFENSLALYNIRIVEGFAGLFSINSRPFTLGDTIYMKDVVASDEPEVLLHECIHVWQFQHFGASYIGRAVGAQWFIDDEYNWEKFLDSGRSNWVDFNKESQGQFHGDLYPNGELLTDNFGTIVPLMGDGVFYDADRRGSPNRFIFNGVDHTDRANDAVEAVRSRRSYRLSSIFQ